MPFLTCPMGISSKGTSGQRRCHIARETSPWSLLTPLIDEAKRQARTAIENGSPPSPGFSRPRSRSVSTGIPSFLQYPERYLRTRSASKRSMPAGTAVCVVKMLVAATSPRASSNERECFSIRWRVRSSAKNAECPSFMCVTVGGQPIAARALIPPIPRTSSCLIRISCPPP